MENYTPGRWFTSDYQSVHDEEGRLIADCNMRFDGSADANARLIALAPEMLRLLEIATDHLHASNYEGEEDILIERIEALLAEVS